MPANVPADRCKAFTAVSPRERVLVKTRNAARTAQNPALARKHQAEHHCDAEARVIWIALRKAGSAMEKRATAAKGSGDGTGCGFVEVRLLEGAQTAIEAISDRMKPKQGPGSLELPDIRLAQRLHSPFYLVRIFRQGCVDNYRRRHCLKAEHDHALGRKMNVEEPDGESAETTPGSGAGRRLSVAMKLSAINTASFNLSSSACSLRRSAALRMGLRAAAAIS